MWSEAGFVCGIGLVLGAISGWWLALVIVRILTGASGGMVGAAAYVGSLQPPSERDRHRDLDGQAVGPQELIDRVATDSLGTVARELVFKDLLLPSFLHPLSDRGRALEGAWERNTRILGRPVISRARRIVNRFASVAVRQNCQ